MNLQFSILSRCRRAPFSLCRPHCWVQPQPPSRPFLLQQYHHLSRCKNNDDRECTADERRMKTAMANSNGHNNISATIPKMGRGVKVGQYAITSRTYTIEEVDSFGRLIRDFNPLHSSISISSENHDNDEDDDDVESEKRLIELQRSVLQKAGLLQFESDDVAGNTKPLVHGMFVSSIFSSIFASIAPGCVYVNQGLDFCAPVFAGDTLTGCIHIERIRDTRRRPGIVVECHTRVYKASSLLSSSVSFAKQESYPVEAQLVVKGRANVWLPIGHASGKK